MKRLAAILVTGGYCLLACGPDDPPAQLPAQPPPATAFMGEGQPGPTVPCELQDFPNTMPPGTCD